MYFYLYKYNIKGYSISAVTLLFMYINYKFYITYLKTSLKKLYILLLLNIHYNIHLLIDNTSSFVYL